MRPDPKEFHRKQEILRLAVKPNIHKATVSSSRKKNDTKQNLRRHAVALPNSMVGGQIMQEREAQERIKVERRRREKEFSQAVNNDQVYLEAVGESSKEGTDENNRAVINNLMSVTMREAMQRMHKRKEAEVYEKQQLLIASQSPLENENGIFKGAIKDLFLDSQDDLAVHDEEEDKAEPPSVLPMREYDITRRESQYDPSIKNQEYNTLVNNLKKSLVVKAEPVSHKPAAKKSGNRRKSHANTAFRCEDESEDHSSAVLRATTRNDIPAIPKPIKVVVAAPPPPPKKASPPKLAPAITDKRRMSVVKEMRPAFKATPVKTTVFTPTIPVKLRNNLQDRVPFGKSNHSSTESIESMEETFVEDEDTFGVGLNKNEVDYEIASHYIWNLIRYREASKKNNALNTIVEQFWFPGLKVCTSEEKKIVYT